jgi:hypothetical protein
MLYDSLESPIVFWTLEGSYFSDFNFRGNNFPRSMLAKPNYNLAVLPLSSRLGVPVWSLDQMALGEHIGAAWLASVNNASSQERYRWLCLLGDRTLRLNRVKPPTNAHAVRTGSSVDVSWSLASGVSQYFIYRAGIDPVTQTYGTFVLVGGPYDHSPVTGIPDGDGTKRTYMVRGAALASTGRGSYWNLSQGSINTTQ